MPGITRRYPERNINGKSKSDRNYIKAMKAQGSHLKLRIKDGYEKGG